MLRALLIAKECGWTPVSEGLPEGNWADCFVLVSEECGRYASVEAVFSNGKFYRQMIINHNCNQTAHLAIDVDYWMLRPCVPEYKEECGV